MGTGDKRGLLGGDRGREWSCPALARRATRRSRPSALPTHYCGPAATPRSLGSVGRTALGRRTLGSGDALAGGSQSRTTVSTNRQQDLCRRAECDPPWTRVLVAICPGRGGCVGTSARARFSSDSGSAEPGAGQGGAALSN